MPQYNEEARQKARQALKKLLERVLQMEITEQQLDELEALTDIALSSTSKSR